MDDPIRHPLAHARELRGWSQGDLVSFLARAARGHGLRSGADKAAVSRWENGRKTPNTDSQLLIAEVFGVPLSEMETYGWPYWLPGRDEPLPLGAVRTVQALHDAQRASMDRRSFMTFSAISLAGLAAHWAVIEPERLASAMGGKQVDAELVDWLEDTSQQLTALPTEQRQHTIRLMDAHLATVTDLIEDGRYSEGTGRRLHLTRHHLWLVPLRPGSALGSRQALGGRAAVRPCRRRPRPRRWSAVGLRLPGELAR